MPQILDATDIELRNVKSWRRKLGLGDATTSVFELIQSIVEGDGDDTTTIERASERLAAFATLEEAGYLVQTSTDPPTFAGRQIVGTPNQIVVTYGTGIPGNTILAGPQDLHSGAQPMFQTIRPTLLTPDFVTYVNATGHLASTLVTLAEFHDTVITVNAMDQLTTLGDLLTHNGTTYVRFPIGTNDQFLRVDGTNFVWETVAAGSFPHTLLDSTVHTDTATQTVSRGSIIRGDATPAWNELTIGGSGTFLRSDGTDPSWQALVVGDVPAHDLLSATHGDTLAAGVSRGSLIVGNATPKWSELVVGAANRLLRSDGTDASWAQAVLTTDVTGVLPIANGGTNANAFNSEGIVYCRDDGTTLISSADFGYDDTIDTLFNRSVIVAWRAVDLYSDSQDASAVVSIGTWLTGTDAANTSSYIRFGKEQNWTGTASTRASYVSIETVLDNSSTQALGLRSSGSVVCGKDATGTARTTDFLYIPSSAGNPSGVAEEYGSRCPLVYDTTNNELFCYNPTDNTWRSAVFT